MRKTTLSRTLLLTAALAVGGSADVWAQQPTYDANAPVTSIDGLTNGDYVLDIHNTSGESTDYGLVYYDANTPTDRPFKAQFNYDFEDGIITDDSYIWTLTWNEDHTAFSLQNKDGVYFSVRTMQTNYGRGDMLAITSEDEIAWYVPENSDEENRFFMKLYGRVVADGAGEGVAGQPLYLMTNNPGGYKNLSYWNSTTPTNAQGAVRMQFLPVTGSFNYVDVTYVYRFNGQQVASEKFQLVEGESLPPVRTLPAYVTATAPEGVVTAGTTQYIIDCVLADNFPFVVSESYDNATWCAVGLHSAPYYLHNTEGAESMTLGQTEQTIDASSNDAFAAQLWCVTGNPFDGFKLYNRAAGAGKILSSGNPAGADGTTYPVLMDESSLPEGNNTTWDILPSTNIAGINGFYIARHGEAANKMNLRSGRLAYWTGGADAGSTFRALGMDDLYAANLDVFTRGYVGAPSADVLSANSELINALAGGTGTPEQYVALSQALDAAMQEGNTVALDPSKLYRIQNLARKASTGNTNDVGNGGFLEVTDKTVTEYTVDMAAIDGDPTRVTALWQVQPIEGEDGHFRLYNPNAGVYVGSVVESSFLTTAETADAAGNMSLVSLGRAQYRLRNEQRNGPLHASGPNANNRAGIQIYSGDLNSPSAWYIIPAESVSLTVGTAGYATLNLPVAVSLPEGLTAYTATGEAEDAVTLSEVEGNTLPAGSPVIVAGEAGTYPLTLLPQNADASLDANGFRGTTMAAAVPDDVNAYVLAMKEGDATPKFYQLAESAVEEIPVYSRLVCVATDDRANRVVELLNEASTDIIGVVSGAQANRLWSNATVDETDPYQLWGFEADPAGSGKYAMVCKAVPAGSVNPMPTAEATTGRWDYDATAKHYNFTLTEVEGNYTIKSDQVTGDWWMNFAGNGQGYSINLYSDPASGSAGYFKPEVVEAQEVVDNTPRIIAANKAYYVSGSAATAAFTLSFGGTTTGIDAVEAADGAEKATIYYDLSGRRVLYPSNGIFVTADGQKVFIK